MKPATRIRESHPPPPILFRPDFHRHNPDGRKINNSDRSGRRSKFNLPYAADGQRLIFLRRRQIRAENQSTHLPVSRCQRGKHIFGETQQVALRHRSHIPSTPPFTPACPSHRPFPLQRQTTTNTTPMTMLGDPSFPVDGWNCYVSRIVLTDSCQ